MGLLSALGLSKENVNLAVGAKAPGLTLLDAEGNKVDLGEVFSQGLTLIYFYPKALTPVCTAQACEFRDHHAAFTGKEIKIFGTSRDKQEALQRFKERHKIPFPLLSDPDGKLARAFGIPIIFGLSARQTYLIRNGIVAWRDLHPRVGNQVSSILAAIGNLSP